MTESTRTAKELLERRAEFVRELKSQTEPIERAETRSAIIAVDDMLKRRLSPEDFAKLKKVYEF